MSLGLGASGDSHNRVAAFDPTSPGSVLRFAQSLSGRTLSDVMPVRQLERWESDSANKGDMGHAVEFTFGVERNSDAAPDLPEAGIEIKVVPVHFERGMMTVKERCYLGQIDWRSVANSDFDGSTADTKTRRILFVFYEWVKDQDPLDTQVLDVALWDRDDLATTRFREAWDVVRSRLRHGVGHLTSAGDSPVVAASTKGTGSWQPSGGGEPVRARAWAIKEDHMQVLLRELSSIPPFPSTSEAYAELLSSGLRRFRGWSARDLAVRVLEHPYSEGNKSYHRNVIDRLIGYLADLSERGVEVEGRPSLRELKEMGLNLRAVRFDASTLIPDQDISFPNVTFFDIAELSFDEHWISDVTLDLALALFTVEDTVPDSRYVDTIHWRPDDEQREMLRHDYECIQEAVRASNLESRPGYEERGILRLGTKDVRANARPEPLPDGTMSGRPNFYLDGRAVGAVLRDRLALPLDLTPRPVRLVAADGAVRVIEPTHLG